MLRQLFGEPERVDGGLLLDAKQSIAAFIEKLRDPSARSDLKPKIYRLQIWASGFNESLNELEESCYCSGKFQMKVNKAYTNEMSRTELNDYYAHLYFYKNAFIRIFSTLDKLAYFMNDFLELDTEQHKSRFSYFTVLRHMYQHKLHKELEQRLFHLKENYEQPLDRLRKKRNYEIHSVNVEMLDDLMRAHGPYFEHSHIENIASNMDDLWQAFDMVCTALQTVFTYCGKILDNK